MVSPIEAKTTLLPPTNSVSKTPAQKIHPKGIITKRLGPKPLELSAESLPKRAKNYEPSHGYVTNEFGGKLHMIKIQAIGELAQKIPSDTAVLFVPGLWSTATMVFPAMKELATQGISSYAFSQEGHGRSSDSDKDKINFSLSRYLHNLETIVKSLESSGVTKICLVGHSFGGYLVQKYLESKDCSSIISAPLIASIEPAGSLRANLRFALKNPWGFIKAHLTLNASVAMENPTIAAKVLFSTTPENLPKGCELSKESIWANYGAMQKIDTEAVKNSGVPIQVIGTKEDQMISSSEVARTAQAYETTAKTIEGPHMWMADPLARKQLIEILTSTVKEAL